MRLKSHLAIDSDNRIVLICIYGFCVAVMEKQKPVDNRTNAFLIATNHNEQICNFAVEYFCSSNNIAIFKERTIHKQRQENEKYIERGFISHSLRVCVCLCVLLAIVGRTQPINGMKRHKQKEAKKTPAIKEESGKENGLNSINSNKWLC